MAQAFYEEPAKQIPVVGSYDVIVAGGGPAGIGAAIAAARNGAKTLLLEQTAQLGGMAVPGMMSHWCTPEAHSTRAACYDSYIDSKGSR